MNVLDTMTDPALFAPWFAGKSWRPWRVALAALFGLAEALREPADLALFRECTGRDVLPSAPAREGWFICGRRGGKSRVAAAVAVYLAAFRDYAEVLAPGERAIVATLAADRRQAQVCFRYIEALIDSVPMLARLVESRTREAIHLSNGVSLEVHVSNFRSIRGHTFAAVIADEIAYWRAEDESANPDSEILAALRPGMATVPGALLLVISSPYARRGELWRAYREHFGKRGDVFVWKAPSLTMNPTLDPGVVERAYADDPAAASAEYGAEFRSDVEGFVTREAVEAVVVPERFELPPLAGVRYHAFCDPSGGASDSMTLAVAHTDERDGIAVGVLDCLRERPAPFDPDDVVRDFVETLRTYRVSEVTGDRYAAQWCSQAFERAGVRYVASEKPKSELYRELLPAINSKRLELLDHTRMLAQLVGLERRTARGGRESIDHAPNGRDDVANAVAGVASLVVGKRHRPTMWLGRDGLMEPDPTARVIAP